jgi:transposase
LESPKVSLIASVVHVFVEPRKGSRGICSGCGKRGPTAGTQPSPRHFDFVPLWNLRVMLIYWMRRIDCPRCGVKVEQVPWAEGKHQACNAYRLFLARWAKRLSWTEVADIFKTSWGVVFRSVQWVVAYGLVHRDLQGVRSIGVDEIAVWAGHRYLTVVYQIDEGGRRLLWLWESRTKDALGKFFEFWGKKRTAALRFVCSDMWQAYIQVIAKKAGHALHVLDRFHIVSNMNKVIDKVRASEARELARAGYEPVLKNSRWCFLKRKRNLTSKQRRTLSAVLRYSLKTVRTYLLAESLHALWKYVRPESAGWFLDRWCTRALRSRIAPVKRFARTLRKHRELILNYFRAKREISAGAVEGMNLNAKLAIRKARGFRTYQAMETALYHQLGRLPEPKFTHTFC